MSDTREPWRNDAEVVVMFPSELTGREWLAFAGMDGAAAAVMATGYLAGVPFLVGLAGVTLLATSFAALRARRY